MWKHPKLQATLTFSETKRNAYRRILTTLCKFSVDNTYVTYQGNIWKQQIGLPMGSSLSPDLANLFLAWHEDLDGLAAHGPTLFNAKGMALKECVAPGVTIHLFRRLIDDYTIIVSNATHSDALALTRTVSGRLQPLGLEVNWQIHFESLPSLDLVIYKDVDFLDTGKLAFRTYSKPGHRRQYIPRNSMHQPGVFKSFVKAELLRLVYTNSTFEMFWLNANLLRQRLLVLGYSDAELHQSFAEVSYYARKRRLHSHTPQGHSSPSAKDRNSPNPLLFFKIPYDTVSFNLNLPVCVRNWLHNIRAEVEGIRTTLHPQTDCDNACSYIQRVVPMVCWLKGASLGSLTMRPSRGWQPPRWDLTPNP